MYLTTHAAVGILISQAVDRPLWVFLLSLLSHFVLDFIPHGDEDMGAWVRKKPVNAVLLALVDLGILTLLLGGLYASQNLPQMARISAGVIGAVLPDFISSIFPVIHHYANWLFAVRLLHRLQYRLGLIPLWRGHDWFHRLTHGTIRTKISFKRGLILQVVIVLGALAIALGYHYSPSLPLPAIQL